MKYDEEEKNIIDAYESGKMKLSTPLKKELENIKAIAKNTFKKIKDKIHPISQPHLESLYSKI